MRREDQFAADALQTLPRDAKPAEEEKEEVDIRGPVPSSILPKPPTLGHCGQDADAADRRNWESSAGQQRVARRETAVWRPYDRHIFAVLRGKKSLRSRSSKPFAGNTLRSLKRTLRPGRYGN
jgi:hypothetical protein